MAITNDANYYGTNFSLNYEWLEGFDGKVRESDDDEHYRTLIAYFVVSAAVLGLLLNAFVIVLSVFHVQVHCS